jgi:hypothetical protein
VVRHGVVVRRVVRSGEWDEDGASSGAKIVYNREGTRSGFVREE